MKRFLLYLMLLVTQVTGLTAVHAATKEAYAVLSTDQSTLSFYYDTNKSSRSGTVYTAANFRKFTTDSWGAYRSNITKVVFDSFFANYTG